MSSKLSDLTDIGTTFQTTDLVYVARDTGGGTFADRFADISRLDTRFQVASAKGQASGYVGLDSGQRVLVPKLVEALGPFPLFGLPNWQIKGFSFNLASGTSDIYTVPNGKQAFMMGAQLYNSAGTSTTYYGLLKRAGVYYRQLISTVVSTTARSIPENLRFAMVAGDSLSFNTTQTGLNLLLKMVEFDPGSQLVSVVSLNTASGNTTLYTCPNGKQAAMCLQPHDTGISVGDTSVIRMTNEAASSETSKWYCVRSGGSISASTQFAQIITVTNASSTIQNRSIVLDPGDFIAVNLSVGGAGTYTFNVLEY